MKKYTMRSGDYDQSLRVSFGKGTKAENRILAPYTVIALVGRAIQCGDEGFASTVLMMVESLVAAGLEGYPATFGYALRFGAGSTGSALEKLQWLHGSLNSACIEDGEIGYSDDIHHPG